MGKRKFSRINKAPDEPKVAIGIACQETDYKTCWDINNLLTLQLTKIQNHFITAATGEIFEFPLYCFMDEQNNIKYHLIANKGKLNFLSEKYKNIDYFIILSGNITAAKIEKLLNKIKVSQFITAAFIMPNQLFKNTLLPS